jgi:thiosulfate/3-mercaptopyruvate sulfurtransferase
MGHTNVQVLDGGFPKWVKDGCPVQSSDRDFKNEDFAYKLVADRVWNLDNVKAFEGAQDSAHFIDVRAPDQFAAGTIKGASNLPVGKIMNMDTKTMKTAEERKAVFAEAGIDLSKNITLSCQGGVAATVVYHGL